MNNVRKVVCNFLLLAGAAGLVRAQGDRIIVHPQDTGVALINPGMGWMFHHYDNNLRTYTVHWYPREFLAANPDLVNRINMRLGYRLQLVEASWPAEVPAAGSMAIGYAWRNAGVAPCLPGGHPTITLKDAQAGIAGVFVDDDFNVRELPVGPPDRAMIISRKELGPKIEENDKPLLTFMLPPAHILKPGT